jgi:hypothetical protein
MCSVRVLKSSGSLARMIIRERVLDCVGVGDVGANTYGPCAGLEPRCLKTAALEAFVEWFHGRNKLEDN